MTTAPFDAFAVSRLLEDPAVGHLIADPLTDCPADCHCDAPWHPGTPPDRERWQQLFAAVLREGGGRRLLGALHGARIEGATLQPRGLSPRLLPPAAWTGAQWQAFVKEWLAPDQAALKQALRRVP